MSAQTTLPIEQHRPEDLVFVSQTNTLSTDSILVAKYFGKRHEQVLRRLKTIDCSPEFSQHNFVLTHYHDEQDKVRPKYQMTKDGFMFLVMGFTGKKAAAIKEAYINAFNLMAAKLAPQPQPLPLELFTSEDELMKKFMQGLHVRVMFEIDGGKIASSTVVPENAFICTKEKLFELMRNNRIFNNRDIVLINSIAANRIAEM